MNVQSGALRSLVVRPASHDSTLVHVRMRDESVLPGSDELRWWLDSMVIEHPQLKSIRTAALFPRAATRFAEAGFEVVDRLMLLRADLRHELVRAACRRRDDDGSGSTRTMRRHHLAAAAAIDNAAFGQGWGHDAADLDEICRATPVHSARRRTSGPRMLGSRRRGDLVAFAIAGASSDHGYLQRLAVDPRWHRRGHGRALTVDALRWMIRRRLPDCLVNTSVDNTAALAMYTSVGFTSMAEHLTVLHFDCRCAR